MGEVKIKSGNLFDINGNYSAYVYQGSPTCRVDNGQIIVNSIAPYYFAYINFSALIPSGQYTVKCKASANFRAMRLLLTKPFDTGTWNDSYQRYYVDMIKNDDYYTYTFTVDEDFAIGFAISGTTGDTGVVDEIMFNEGSTALPYQPYFLNKPAHKFTNGEWIDIPTHKYTNGRWQGELTSQSPLKFRADGVMLDWRIEGRTSENLFDINGEHISNSRLGITCFVVDNDKLVVKIISPGGTTRISYPHDFYNPSTYTVSVKLTGELTGIRLLSTSPFPGGTYNATYRAYWKAMTLNDGIYTTTFSPTETTTIGFIVMGADDARNPGTVENIQLLEGTYTTSTIPPYEPYGGVGDYDETEQKYRIPVTVNGVTTNLYTDRQLMDGDSIDYATDQTQIPIATGNNTLTVDTAVKPKNVFVKFEG